jgi:hypothetical protein
MNQGETRTVPLAGVVPGVPANAVGVIANLTVHSTVNGGYVTAFPAGASKPATSSINWGLTGTVIANGTTVALGTGGALSLFADASVSPGAPATHLILDNNGYVL